MSATHRNFENQKTLTNIFVTAVQNRLVAPLTLTDTRQSLNDAQTKLLALDLWVDSNILYMSNTAQASQKLVLNEHTADSNDLVCRFVNDDQGKICARCSTEQVEARLVCSKTRVGNKGKNRED